MALFDAFLKLDGIKGESSDGKHKGEIDIESFSWGMSQTGVSATGGGGGAGKVKFFDISFIKKTDSSSPLLMLNCANGAHIKEASFAVRKAGGTQLEYLKIKLTDVLVSSYKPHGLYLANTANGWSPSNIAASAQVGAVESYHGNFPNSDANAPLKTDGAERNIGNASLETAGLLGDVSSFYNSMENNFQLGTAGGEAGGLGVVIAADGIPGEQFSLNFARIEMSYQPQGADGKAQGGPIIAGWDVKANQKV